MMTKNKMYFSLGVMAATDSIIARTKGNTIINNAVMNKCAEIIKEMNENIESVSEDHFEETMKKILNS